MFVLAPPSSFSQSDPDLPADPQTPSSTELGKYSGLPSHALQYVPPQPSIEEARQTMHSLLDDAFALVAPSTQASITHPGGSGGQSTSTPVRAPRDTPSSQWGSPYSQAHTVSSLIDAHLKSFLVRKNSSFSPQEFFFLLLLLKGILHFLLLSVCPIVSELGS